MTRTPGGGRGREGPRPVKTRSEDVPGERVKVKVKVGRNTNDWCSAPFGHVALMHYLLSKINELLTV